LPLELLLRAGELDARIFYVPFVNWAMMVLTVALTVSFGSSDRGTTGAWPAPLRRHRWPANPGNETAFAPFLARLKEIRAVVCL
jgi:hypothetical protein